MFRLMLAGALFALTLGAHAADLTQDILDRWMAAAEEGEAWSDAHPDTEQFNSISPEGGSLRDQMIRAVDEHPEAPRILRRHGFSNSAQWADTTIKVNWADWQAMAAGQLDQADLAAANWAWANDRPAGRGSDTLPGAKRLFLPMRTGRGPIGVIGIDDDRSGPLLTPDQRRLLDALVDQGALAIERVLLVEDDRAISQVIMAALEAEGCSVDHCTSIARRNALVASKRYAAILTDVMLEDGDGIATLGSVLERQPDTPVIVLSAQNTLDTAVRASEAGAYEYFPKPFDLDALVSAVREA